MRPAGILIPEGAGRRSLQAGFGQIEAQVMKVGMAARSPACPSPSTVIPMVGHKCAGLHRRRPISRRRAVDRCAAGDAAGHIPGFLEPLYKGGLDDVTPGSSCIANAYSSNHDIIVAKDTGFFGASLCMSSMPLRSCTRSFCGFRRWCSPSRYWCSAGTERSPGRQMQRRLCWTGIPRHGAAAGPRVGADLCINGRRSIAALPEQASP